MKECKWVKILALGSSRRLEPMYRLLWCHEGLVPLSLDQVSAHSVLTIRDWITPWADRPPVDDYWVGKVILCLYGFKRAFRSCSGCCWSCALRDSSAALYLLGQWSSAGSCEEDIWRAGRRSEAFNARFLNATPQGGLEMAQRWLTRHCNDRRSVGLSQRAKAFHFPARRSWQEKPGNCCNSSFIWFAIGFHLLWAAFDSFSFSSSSHELVVWVIARALIVRSALVFL